ncbi:YkvA family protein [Cronbergia sp. UHCC 0137]|uniref:YkvA family protein n=1 Tax=Cronbergia sp. UHCC 0137 TaxID=3110239 RepID=UPI002B1EB1AC|nr:YkvA family protein [Cronbergia sp. UHCC 0137]MEA5620721.1 YkvA family protein [Cronbergia sp. UHCC 0137]
MNFSIQTVYNWYRDLLRNPKYRWWIIIGTLAYLASPIDIAPDFIPIIGQIDDVFLVTLLVSEVSALLIDGWKSRQGSVDSNANNEVADSGSTTDTVDVDAVSVK